MPGSRSGAPAVESSVTTERECYRRLCAAAVHVWCARTTAASGECAAEREALFEVELDTLGVGGNKSDCEVLAERELEVAAAEAHDDRTVDSLGPGDRSARDQPQLLENGIATLLRGLDDARVALWPERDAVRTVDACAAQRCDGAGDRSGKLLVVLIEGNGVVR